LTAVVILALLAPGCAANRSVTSQRAEIERLQRENFQLRKDLAEARVRLEMQAEAGTGSVAAESAAAIDSGASPLRESQPSQAASRVVYSEPITDASRYTTGPLPQTGADPLSSAGQLMMSGKRKLDSGDQAAAMAAFRDIVARYPQDALADDAQFGVGECLFQMGRYEEAISEYRRVVNDFPFGDQVPSAFLKIAFSHLGLEQRELALDSFRTVSEAYPGTEAATVARQQIAHLKARPR